MVFLRGCAAKLSAVARGMNVFTLVMVLPGEVILIWAASSLWGMNAPTYFALLGLAGFPLLIGLLFAASFESVTRLPQVIESNVAVLSRLVRTDIPDVSAQLKAKQGGWRVARSAGKVFVGLWQVQDELLGGNLAVFNAAMMANPLYWIVYGMTLAACVVMSVVLLLALLVGALV